MKKVLAFDMGATSIRGIVGYVENGQFCTKEVMRMSHKIQNKEGRLYWDFDAIAKKIEETIKKRRIFWLLSLVLCLILQILFLVKNKKETIHND